MKLYNIVIMLNPSKTQPKSLFIFIMCTPY